MRYIKLTLTHTHTLPVLRNNGNNYSLIAFLRIKVLLQQPYACGMKFSQDLILANFAVTSIRENWIP